MNDSKLDKISNNVAEIRTDIALIKADISYHIKRTTQNEEMLRLLRKELKPVEIHVQRVHGALKLLGAAVILLGVIKTLLELSKMVH